MTGLLDGRGGMRTTPPEGVGLCPAPSIERPSVEHTAGRGHAGTGGSPSPPVPPPADGRSVLTERGAKPTPEEPAGCEGMFRRSEAAATKTPASPPRSANALEECHRAFLAWQHTQPQYALDLEV